MIDKVILSPLYTYAPATASPRLHLFIYKYTAAVG